jgi:hypothetical protein
MLQGIAGVAEIHYVTTLQDADFVLFDGPGFVGALQTTANRIDLLNLTGGLQFQIGPLANIRVGCVVPLKLAPNRQFDSEMQVSYNRFF